MGTSQTARKKFNFFEEIFEKARKEHISINEKKLISIFVIKYASTARRAKEILQTFEDAEIICRIGSEIVHKSQIKEFRENPSTFQEKLTETL